MESASIDANGAILLAHRSATSATLDGLQFGHHGLECVLQWNHVAIAFRLAAFNLAKLCHVWTVDSSLLVKVAQTDDEDTRGRINKKRFKWCQKGVRFDLEVWSKL